MEQNEKTSLERSHSKTSNAKLTLLCLITIVFTALFWLILGYSLKNGFTSILYIALGVDAILVILHLIGFNKFKR